MRRLFVFVFVLFAAPVFAQGVQATSFRANINTRNFAAYGCNAPGCGADFYWGLIRQDFTVQGPLTAGTFTSVGDIHGGTLTADGAMTSGSVSSGTISGTDATFSTVTTGALNTSNVNLSGAATAASMTANTASFGSASVNGTTTTGALSASSATVTSATVTNLTVTGTLTTPAVAALPFPSANLASSLVVSLGSCSTVTTVTATSSTKALPVGRACVVGAPTGVPANGALACVITAAGTARISFCAVGLAATLPAGTYSAEVSGL